MLGFSRLSRWNMSLMGLLCMNSIKNETEALVLVPLGEIRVLLG